MNCNHNRFSDGSIKCKAVCRLYQGHLNQEGSSVRHVYVFIYMASMFNEGLRRCLSTLSGFDWHFVGRVNYFPGEKRIHLKMFQNRDVLITLLITFGDQWMACHWTLLELWLCSTAEFMQLGRVCGEMGFACSCLLLALFIREVHAGFSNRIHHAKEIEIQAIKGTPLCSTKTLGKAHREISLLLMPWKQWPWLCQTPLPLSPLPTRPDRGITATKEKKDMIALWTTPI